MRCETCGKDLPEKGEGAYAHRFSGYGWYVGYCAEHCPRELDGTECDDHDDESPAMFVVNTRDCKPMTSQTAEALGRMGKQVYDNYVRDTSKK